jgi:hypothetical protein
VTDSNWTVGEDPLHSDHRPLLLKIARGYEKVEPTTRENFNYDKANWILYQNILNRKAELMKQNFNIEIFYDEIRQAILDAAHQAIPKKKVGLNQSTMRLSPWWSEDCDEAVRTKRKAYQNYNRQPGPDTFKLKKHAEDVCNQALAKAKLNYLNKNNNKISNYKDLPYAWKQLNKIKRRYTRKEPPLTHGGGKTKNNQQKANLLAQTFARASQTRHLPKQERERRAKKGEVPDPPPQNDHLINALITRKELLNTIDKVKNTQKATGADPISYIMIGQLPDIFFNILLTFYQRCWTEGLLPSAWRDAEVVGIPKAGKPRGSPKNYRPISLTPQLGKIYERMATDRLNYYLEKNNIIPEFQAGFRKHRSCADHIASLSAHVKHAFSRRQRVYATFFDIKGAYDTVWHDKLLCKLIKIGLSGHMYNFIKQFLTKRQMRVRVGQAYSPKHELDAGVPQGSVIAPTLFNIMLYDFNKVDLGNQQSPLCR